ncbi:MAG: hypothetical protein U0230_09815 [Polyangiales bacterium]
MEPGEASSVEVRLLGPVRVLRAGAEVDLPRSRKTRALLALLALAREPLSRARLCDLLWEGPSDPRAELRWCLSKLRAVVDEPGRRRIDADPSVIAFDRSGVLVDGALLDELAAEGVGAASTARLRELDARVRGDFLDGMILDGSELAAWIEASRERYRRIHAEIRAELARRERALEVLSPTPGPPGTEPGAREEARHVPHGSVLVLPFEADTEDAKRMAHAMADDVIDRLARLRSLFVIARGTAHALHDRGIEPLEAGRLACVEYVATGTARRTGEKLALRLEVLETRHGALVVTEELEVDLSAPFGAIDAIAGTIAEEIERSERRRAVQKPPSSLDAWEAYHRGLWHAYRFTGPDNALGAHFFREALARDPGFARAHAGLSFTHFQNAFLGLVPDRESEIAKAFDSARESLASDERDPAAHWAMGRALWLRSAHEDSIAALERSVALGPSFALGHYMLAFVHAQSGDPELAIAASDTSRRLSPFDPLQFGMIGSRALAHLRLGQHDEAAEWAVRAATRPNAHAHILAIAAASLALADRGDRAREFVARIREQRPGYTVDDFLHAFHLARETERGIRGVARSIGFG